MLTKPLILVVTVLLSFTLLFGYLSYNFYGKKVDVESKLSDMTKQLSSLQKSYDKQAKSCLIGDSINTELLQENKKLVEDKQDILRDITKLPPKQPTTRKQDEMYVDINGKLPPALGVLLDKAYHDSKGKADANAE